MPPEDQSRDRQTSDGSHEADVAFSEVRASELDEISRRRAEAEIKDPSQSPAKNLVGLALSGGGIRSAAFSLGVIHSLRVRGVLPFVDYLSTVSGGGYAGAFVSSYVLGARQNWKAVNASAQPANRKLGEKPEGADQAAEAPVKRPLPLSDAALLRTGKFPIRMLQFLFGGNYLRHTWVFFNRYLMGLLLIWIVTFSGLIAAASGIAYAFRSLEAVRIRSWLAALGFDGDVRLAFFLTFVLLLIWIATWAISYFRSLARAEGNAARHVFYVMIITALVATASLIGVRHISLDHGTPTESANAAWIGQTLGTVLISAIGASLIPYLRPKALIRSGTNPQNAAEKYTFWIASRALLYGVPFVAVAWFARENLSDFNQSRDSALDFSEVKGWDSAYAPLFSEIRAESVAATEDSDPPYKAPGSNIWKALLARTTENMKTTGNVSEQPIESEFKKFDTQFLPYYAWLLPDNIWKTLLPRTTENVKTTGNVSEQRIESEFKKLDTQFHAYYAWLLPDNDQNSTADPNHRLGDETRMMSPFKRWWYLAQYAVVALTGEDASGNPTYGLYKTRNEIITCKKRILAKFNGESVLGSPKLYTYFPANEDELDKNLPLKRREQLAAVFPIVKKAKAIDAAQTELNQGDPKPSDTVEVQQRKLLAEEEHDRAVMDVNRELIAAYYPGTISGKNEIFSSVVLDADQGVRWNWFVVSASIFVFFGLIVDLNATSWHAFYSRQMANMWIQPVSGSGKDGRDIPLARLSTVEYGWPYHLISGSLQLFGRRRTSATLADRQSFLFSRLYCGTDALSYAPTKDYMGGNYSLADAVAISGAAVSPIQSRNPLVTALMFIFNVRLGQWVANPRYASWLPKRLANFVAELPFTPVRLLSEMAQNAEDRPHCFVTDGGHYENLAIEPLLKRRCQLIMASDAGQDEEYQFLDLMRLIRWARINQGIEVKPLAPTDGPLDLSCLIPDEKTKLSAKHVLIAKILYPDDGNEPAATGYLIYLKSSLCKDDPCDLLNYRRIHPQFPHDETSDQFYDSDRFFCYWQLGTFIAERACDNLPPNFENGALSTNVDDFIKSMVGANAPPQAGAATSEKGGPEKPETSEANPEIASEMRSTKEALAVLGPIALNTFGRENLNPVSPLVLADILKMLDPLETIQWLDHGALDRLTRKLRAMTQPAKPTEVRRDATSALGEVLRFAKTSEARDLDSLINGIEKTLERLRSGENPPEVVEAAAAGLKMA